VEFNGFINNNGLIPNLNMRWYIHIHLLGGIFSYMVVKESGSDKEKMVKVERYRYSITELSIEIRNFFTTKFSFEEIPPAPAPL